TPHLWRQYLENLLRYEQLLRADDRAAAEKVLARAASLRRTVLESRALKLNAAAGSLAMPAALGWGVPAGDAAREKELRRLGEKGKPAEVKKRLDRWLAEAKGHEKRLLRVRLGGLLARRLADAPEGEFKAELERVARLLAAPDGVPE